MAVIRVTSSDLEMVSHQIKVGSDAISDQLRQLQSAVNNLIGNGWQSQASGQFDQMYQQWNQSAGQLNQALEGISQLLDGAAKAYQQTEDAIAKSMDHQGGAH